MKCKIGNIKKCNINNSKIALLQLFAVKKIVAVHKWVEIVAVHKWVEIVAVH